jgi:hypothetical protein
MECLAIQNKGLKLDPAGQIRPRPPASGGKPQKNKGKK